MPNTSLLSGLIPTDAKHILELGCGDGLLGIFHKAKNPDVWWTGLDSPSNPEAQKALGKLDTVGIIDLDTIVSSKFAKAYDTIVVNDLSIFRDPEALLTAAHDISTPAATLACRVPIMSHISIIEQMLYGDITYKTNLRFLSIASAYKMMLDAGWLPALKLLSNWVPGTQFIRAMLEAAKALNIPESTARRNLETYEIYVQCTKGPKPTTDNKTPFSVVVAVNNQAQLDRNISASPGLKEIDAQIICVTETADAAGALKAGKKQAKHPWIVYCHQDVYFPRGSGSLIAEQLAQTSPDTLVGFAGIEAGGRHSGLVIDRVSKFDFPGTDRAVSVDEFAVAMHVDGPHEIDPAFGWHLWGTDLCLKACSAKIIRAPLFHNSTTENVPSEPFKASQKMLIEKYQGRGVILALTGQVQT